MSRILAIVALIALVTGGGRLPADAAGTTVDPGRSFVDMSVASVATIALCASPAVTGSGVGDIVVDVNDHDASLEGAVDSDRARQAAAAIVARVPGVRRVENRLRVVPGAPAPDRFDVPLLRDVRSMLRRSDLDRPRIQVLVGDGFVILHGSVRDVGDRALASRVARRVAGVRAVDNRLMASRLALSAGR